MFTSFFLLLVNLFLKNFFFFSFIERKEERTLIDLLQNAAILYTYAKNKKEIYTEKLNFSEFFIKVFSTWQKIPFILIVLLFAETEIYYLLLLFLNFSCSKCIVSLKDAYHLSFYLQSFLGLHPFKLALVPNFFDFIFFPL